MTFLFCIQIKSSHSALLSAFRIASLSKIFPTLMLYKLWEDGKISSLDDPLEKYVDNFTIKNPLGKTRDSQLKYVTDGLIFLDSGEVQIRSSSVTLRRMASQLSGMSIQQIIKIILLEQILNYRRQKQTALYVLCFILYCCSYWRVTTMSETFGSSFALNAFSDVTKNNKLINMA